MYKDYMAVLGSFVLIAGLMLFVFNWLAILIIAAGIVLVVEGISGYKPFDQAVPPAPYSVCPICNHYVAWVPKYMRYYCYNCQEYI